MKHLLTIISCLLALNLTAQEVVVEYPYNPDFENDGNVGVEDLLQLLSSFGMAFEVAELTIDEVVLSEWLQTISETLIAQQAIIDSLSSLVPVLDSAIVADFLNNASAAVGQTSKSLSFPEGLEGTIVTFEVGPSISYLVEEGKNLYVTDWYGFEPTIDGMPMFTASQSLPLIVAGGRELSNIDDSGNSYGIGILTEATEEVEIIYGSVDLDNPFIVEEGKRLYVTNGWDGGGDAVIQDPEGNTYYISNPPDAIPCIVPSGYSFSSPYNLFESTFSGYLVDEDYFESSSPSNAMEQEVILQVDWSWNTSDTIILESQNLDQIQINFPEEVDPLWLIEGWIPGEYNAEYVQDTVAASEVISHVQNFHSISQMEPIDRIMNIDIGYLNCESVFIQWDKIDDNAITTEFLESVDEAWPNPSLPPTNPCWTSPYKSFFLKVYSQNQLLTTIRGVAHADWLGFGDDSSDCPVNSLNPSVSGHGIKHFRKLASGEWTEVK